MKTYGHTHSYTHAHTHTHTHLHTPTHTYTHTHLHLHTHLHTHTQTHWLRRSWVMLLDILDFLFVKATQESFFDLASILFNALLSISRSKVNNVESVVEQNIFDLSINGRISRKTRRVIHLNSKQFIHSRIQRESLKGNLLSSYSEELSTPAQPKRTAYRLCQTET